MEAVGLITEYNPFHNGHIYHLKKAKKISGADVTVAVMSGNFTQRGEPTILDKWQRARAALLNGVDLVVELPIYMAVQPAHRFADGAVQLLNELRVSSIVFGSEHPNWNFSQLVAAEKNFTKAGFESYKATYATQFNQQLLTQTGVSLDSPNDILAFAYHKAVIENHYKIKLLPIARQGSQYHDLSVEGKIASASAIRKSVKEGKKIEEVVPIETATELLKLETLPNWEQLYPLLRNYLIQTPVERLREIYQMAEGLEYRYKETAKRELTFAGFLKGIKTKRYTYSRLLRVCLYSVLQFTVGQVDEALSSPYLHVLGFNQKGREYLHQIKKQISIPLLTKIGQDEQSNLINLDYRAGKLYQLFTPVEQDLKHAPIIVKSHT